MSLYHLLLYDGLVLTVFGPLLLIAQIACLVHVIRTGRPYWWLWLIFGFPVVGMGAYLFLEVRPAALRGDWNSILWRLKSPQERIRILEAELEDSSTVKNRLRLAEELHAAQHYDRECEVLADGLRGPFKDDSQLLMRLAQAHLEAGRIEEARGIVERTVPDRSVDSQLHYSLLKARVLGKLGHSAEAEALFQDLINRKRSEGPRFFFAEYLLQSGQREDEARAILHDILLRYRRGTPVWRHQERRWFYAAKHLLKSPPVPNRSTSAGQAVEAEVIGAE
jgi:hypothetical protein